MFPSDVPRMVGICHFPLCRIPSVFSYPPLRNFPRQYDSWKRTQDMTFRTKHGGNRAGDYLRVPLYEQ